MRRIAAALFVAVAFFRRSHRTGLAEKPVRFVVGFTPGGPSDILARAWPEARRIVGPADGDREPPRSRRQYRGRAGRERSARRLYLASRNNSILATTRAFTASRHDPVKISPRSRWSRSRPNSSS